MKTICHESILILRLIPKLINWNLVLKNLLKDYRGEVENYTFASRDICAPSCSILGHFLIGKSSYFSIEEL